MTKTIEEVIALWDSGDGKPYKGSLIDRAAYEEKPSHSCMCAQGQVLHLVGGWEVDRLYSIKQSEADKEVANLLGISTGHAILLRQVNDSVDGAPSIVLTHPEKVLGEHAQLVLALFKYLDAMTANDWTKYRTASIAARAAAWAAAWAAARAAAGDAAWAAAGAAAWAAARAAARAAAGAANEIQGHKILAEKGQPLFFLPLFGFPTIQDLIDWKPE